MEKSRMKLMLVCVSILLLVPAEFSMGDWDEGDGHKMHYPQLPKQGGLDVAFNQGRLADDWECSESGPVTDVHFWISWQDDQVWTIEGFSVRIWSDNPMGVNGYSEPNDLLWEQEFYVGDFNVRDMPDDLQGWFDPMSGEAWPDDHWFWQQINVVDIEDPFDQEQGTIYWLEIDMWGAPDCGWKQSGEMQFNDDAVAWDSPYWMELTDPFSADSLDLAFVITGEYEETSEYGDAPESADQGMGDAIAYPDIGVDGAFPTCVTIGTLGFVRHNIGWTGSYFGPMVDGEADGDAGLCPGCFPTYDDDECYQDGDAGLINLANGADSFTIDNTIAVVPCVQGEVQPLGTVCQMATWGVDIDIDIFDPCDGYGQWVNVLADWNRSGDWSGASDCFIVQDTPEHILVDFWVPDGYVGPLSGLAPPGFQIGPDPGHIWFRFTIIDRDDGPLYEDWNGEGDFQYGGETEDYLLLVKEEESEDIDWGDAPDPNYPTLLASNGASHFIVSGAPWLGPADDGPDADADGQPDPSALGDDGDAEGDDEDGVTIPPLTIGVATNIDVEVSGGGGLVYGWIDFNSDGDWDDPCELVVSQNLPDGINPIAVTAPAGSTEGITFARFRITGAAYGASPYGLWDDGEVEDHRVEIMPPDPDPGNDCTDPVLVTLSLAALPYTDTNYTCGRGNHYEDTCLGGYDGGEDIIYELTVTESMDVNVILDPCGTTWSGIAIDDTCPPGSSCMKYSTNSAATVHGFCLHLEPGTYYIMVDTWPAPDCIAEFTLTIEQGNALVNVNDDCDNAQAVGDVVDLAFDTTCATFDGDGKCITSANIWYCYTATCTGDVTVSLCGSSYDTMLAVYNGCSCHPTGAMIGCNDDFDCNGPTLQSQITFAAFAGQDYLIEVGGYSNYTGQGLLTILCDEEADLKWLQRPDLTSTGMDIRISDDGGGGHKVADDFECNEPGLLTHVRLWCSWKDDEVDPIYDFTVTIRDDIPAGTQNPYDGNTYDYSMPGKVLWSREFLGGTFAFEPKEFEISVYADLFPDYEWFWDPFWARDPCEMGDQLVWQIDIEIDPRVAFRQTGTQENPIVYWLEVNAQTPMSSNKSLGWKTSTDHWNDDAVWWDWRIYPVPRVYRELRYPPGHPNEPESMDMAFMISTTDEANEPDGPVKWLQRPDETPNGMDIRCDRSDQVPRWLADDFSCTTTGPITDIHLWCSWRDDFVGMIEMFHLSIHEDLPPYDPCNPYSYSIPGEEVWSRDFYPGEFDESLYLDLDPNYEYWFDPYLYFDDPCGDQFIWQYDFFIDEADAFTQEGDPCEPKIYWLDVYVELDQMFPGTEFGWKTSIDHWNDNAVYWEPDWVDWSMLWYPDGHPLHGAQVDMAFSITQPEVSDELDFGDAPEGQTAVAYPWGVMGSFPTCATIGPAGHIQHGLGWAHFADPAGGGPNWDAESDGDAGLCPGCFPPYDDDECFMDGDAGLMRPGPYTLDTAGSAVKCPASNGNGLGTICTVANWGVNVDIFIVNGMPPDVPGYVNVLMDWNQNGVWSGFDICPPAGAPAPEHVLVDWLVPPGYVGPLSALGPPPFLIGSNSSYVWSRFSITERPVGTSDWNGEGTFEDGETEDYLLLVCQCMGDVDASGSVNFSDLMAIYTEMINQYPNGDNTFVYDIGMPPNMECSDLDFSGSITFSDLMIMYTEMINQYPNGDNTFVYEIGCPF